MPRLAYRLAALSLALLAAGAILTLAGADSVTARARGATVPSSRSASSPAGSAAANEAAARSDASSLLAQVPLEPGATPSADEPAGDGGLLSHAAGGPATPNLVDEHAWWVVPGGRAQALAYVNAHAHAPQARGWRPPARAPAATSPTSSTRRSRGPRSPTC